MLTAASLSARVVDDFNDNVKTAWADFTFVPGFGIPVEQNGQFRFTQPPAGQSIFSASTKTSEGFRLQDARTLEFRVDLAYGLGEDSFAILGWFPAGNPVSSLSGYGLAKSSGDILISKGINKYFYNESFETKNTNVTLVLRLTGQGTSVIIGAQVLDKDNNDAVLWERTVVDTEAADVLADGTDDPQAPYTGDGNVALLCYQDEGTTQPLYEVVFDNLQAFVADDTVLDNFDDNVKTAWQDFSFAPPAGIPVEVNGQFQFTWPPVGQSIFSASTKTSRTFKVADGERVELRVDLIYGLGADSFAVLGWFPESGGASTLSGYGLAKSSTDILITKGINKYFYNENVSPPVKNTNVILVLTLEGRGASVVIKGKVLDMDNNNAVLWERTVVDTEAADILADGTDDPQAPYTGDGNAALLCYEDNGTTQPVYEVVYDNLRASAAPLPANLPPVISDVTPGEFANFVPYASGLSFTVTDDQPLVESGISVTLNGIVFGSGNGLSISGTGANRNVSFAGLSNNVNYVAVLRAVDADNATNSVTLYFDTFGTDNPVLEVEDYNYGSGLYIDNPILVAENAPLEPDGYRYQVGTPWIDYLDSGPSAGNRPYRPGDGVNMQRSLDLVRQKFTDAGGSAMGFYDYDVGGILVDEWLHFTRTFAPGSYEVYLRESLVNMAQGECVLERVYGDPSQPNPFTEVVGSFLGSLTGFRYRNFPLTDASGANKIVLSLSGVHTFRLRQVTPDSPDGGIFQNYLVFIPAPGSGPLRPLITSLSPRNGAVVNTVSPAISVNIRNRETWLNPDSIILELNGEIVLPEIVPDFDGAVVNHAITPLPPPAVLNTARIMFADLDGFWQTNTWSFTITYRHLNPSNRRPGPGTARGFSARMVQAPPGSNLENNITRAEDQLAANSPYPKVMDTNTVVAVVNFSQDPPPANSTPYFGSDISVPGLYDSGGAPLTGGTDDFSMEMLAYLELPAGIYRFGVRTDDGYKIASGATLSDLTAAPLAGRSGTADETFDFVVLQPGLYPFRMVWYERGGGAHAEWFSVDLATGDKTLINDPQSPNSIKAYVTAPGPLFLQSATVATGPYADDFTASIDSGARRIIVRMDGETRFYRLRSDTGRRITTVQRSADNLILTYE
jgi:hypothetical protein